MMPPDVGSPELHHICCVGLEIRHQNLIWYTRAEDEENISGPGIHTGIPPHQHRSAPTATRLHKKTMKNHWKTNDSEASQKTYEKPMEKQWVCIPPP